MRMTRKIKWMIYKIRRKIRAVAPVSKRRIKSIAYKIHLAGGCDAADEYSRGYDDAITIALNILMKETGTTILEVLENSE